MDWDDLRVLLAVASDGSFAQAGRRLGVRHTTVARRVASLETDLGAHLLRRGPAGVSLTVAGEAVVAAARRLAEGVAEVERVAVGTDSRLEGAVSVQAPEPLAAEILGSALASLRACAPGVELELRGPSSCVGDPRHREADVVITELPAAERPSTLDVVARRAGTFGFAFYASRDYLASRPVRVHEPLWAEGHDLVGCERGADEHGRRLLGEERAHRARVVVRTDSDLVAASLASRGVGIAALPSYLATARAELVRVGPVLEERSVWVVAHRDVRRSQRVRAVFRWLVEVLAARLGGEAEVAPRAIVTSPSTRPSPRPSAARPLSAMG